MKICLNGEQKDVPEGVNAGQLLEMLELSGKRIAMEINLEVVPRTELGGIRLRQGDRIEIVQAIGGG